MEGSNMSGDRDYAIGYKKFKKHNGVTVSVRAENVGEFKCLACSHACTVKVLFDIEDDNEYKKAKASTINCLFDGGESIFELV
jgi:hypothetical protein